jgi:hypothetical protein
MTSFAANYLALIAKAKCRVIIYRYADGAFAVAMDVPHGATKAQHRHWRNAAALRHSPTTA